MDIVNAFATQLKLPENAARGLAGQVLGLLEDAVREQVSFGMAARLRNAVPEMASWQIAAPTLRPGTLSIHDVPSPKLDSHAEFQGLLERFRVEAHDASLVSALTLQFLVSRLEPSVLSAIARAMPGISVTP